MRQVKQERTHWREDLSARHRLWGSACYACDVDFLEYDTYGRPVAMVECKRETAPPCDPSHSTMQAQIELANRAGLPMFGLRYAKDFSWYLVVPLNSCAREWLPERTRMTELEWAKFLHVLRKRTMPIEEEEELASRQVSSMFLPEEIESLPRS